MKINRVEILNHLEGLMLSKESNKIVNYGVFINGERIKLSKDKISWKSKNDAYLALIAELEDKFRPDFWRICKRLTYGTEEYKTAWVEYRRHCVELNSIYDEMITNNIIQILPV